jgi:ArsR family transcriptional regulator
MPDSIRRLKAAIFQALAHPTRIAILELLGRGELSAGELIAGLGAEQPDIAQANVSQHLAVLRAQQIVLTRKAGNQVFYSVRDPVILKVLALLRRYLEKHLNDTLSDLDSELQEARR